LFQKEIIVSAREKPKGLKRDEDERL